VAFLTGPPGERPALDNLLAPRAEEARGWGYVVSALRRDGADRADGM
jgi:hypothetical protein